MKVKFLTKRFHHLNIVYKPMDIEKIGGRNRPTKHVHLDFIPNAQGVGELVLSDKDYIEFIKEHPYFKTGHIFIGDIQKDPKPSNKGPKVVQGSLDSKKNEEDKQTVPKPVVPKKPSRKGARVPKKGGLKNK